MMYNLTDTLTTIVACSASIVAILGGFIASKLIAINAERDEVNTRISEIDEEIEFFTKERNLHQAELDEDDALNFVKENIESIVNRRTLEDTYKAEERPQVSKEVLRPYWIRAEQIFESLYYILSELEDKDRKENEEGVPIGVAKKITEDFEYEVCKSAWKHLKVQQFSAHPFGMSLPKFDMPISSGKWYIDTQEKIMSANNRISYLTLQKKQQMVRRKALLRPKGMKLGLVLFAAFSIVNIVVPLCLLPYSIDDYRSYLYLKIFVIFVFSLGLASIMCYLVYLLHWTDREKK